MKWLVIVTIFLIQTIQFASAQTKPVKLKKWTVLIMWSVDNDLYEWSIPYIQRFEKIGTNENINFIAEYDYPGERETERIEILKQNAPSSIESDLTNSRLVMKIKETNSGSAKALENFLRWGIKNYPAENFILIIGSHGYGWRGASYDFPSKTLMPISELSKALIGVQKDVKSVNGKGKLDLVVFDTCNLASLEAATQLADATPYIFGSPFSLIGIDHHRAFLEVLSNKNANIKSLINAYSKYYSVPYRGYPRHGAAALSTKESKIFAKKFDLLMRKVLKLPKQDLLSILKQTSFFTEGQDELKLGQKEHKFDLLHFLKSLIDMKSSLGPQIKDILETIGLSLTDPERGYVFNEKYGTLNRYTYPLTSPVIASSFTKETSERSGFSIACPSDIYLYRKVNPEFKSWAKLCIIWKESELFINSKPTLVDSIDLPMTEYIRLFDY